MSKVIKSFNVYLNSPEKVEIPVPDIDEYDNEISTADENTNDINMEDIPLDIRNKSEEILEKARREAEKIIEQAMQKIDEERDIIIEQAKKNGYEDGYNEAIKQCEDLIQEAAMIKEQAIIDTQQFLSGIEDQTVSIIMEVARKVVGFEISVNKEDILYIVKDAMEKCTQRDNVILKVSEQDYEAVVESKSKLISMVHGVGNIEIKIDYSLEQGGCLIETPYGAIDGSVSTRLNEIEKIFRGLVGRE